MFGRLLRGRIDNEKIMRAVIQRVTRCSVAIDGELHSSIGHGLMVLVAVEESDTREDADWIAAKIGRMRLFNDDAGVMNLSLTQVNGEIMIISQFTLFASTKKGNRPSYIRAAPPSFAVPLYEYFIEKAASECAVVPQTGVFGADMQVELVNDGPVTILIDSKNRE